MDNKQLFEHLVKINGTLAQFRNESDRGAAIVGAAYLDVLLEIMIRERLKKDGPIVDRLFETNGSLGSFGARADIAFAMGLFSELVHRDLTHIRKIRNYFAHNLDTATFDDDKVRSHCIDLSTNARLQEAGQPPEDKPRDMFLMCLSLVSMDIIGLHQWEFWAYLQRVADTPPSTEKPEGE